MSESTRAHRRAGAQIGPVGISIITVSDSRTPETDINAGYLRKQIEAAGHRTADYRLLPDEPELVARAAGEIADKGDARVVVINGGTGISSRDRTYDAVRPLLEREIPGFGELFRMLSYSEIGSAAMLSRATAGIYREMILFSLPGSPAAVRLGWEKLIGPELGHLLRELER